MNWHYMRDFEWHEAPERRFSHALKEAPGRERRPGREACASLLCSPLNAGNTANSPAPIGERPIWSQGQAPLSGGTRLDAFSCLEIHPAAVCDPVVPNRALTPRFAGLRFPPSATSSSLRSPSATCDGLDAHPRSGGSRPACAGLDGGMAAQSRTAGAVHSFSGAWARPQRPSGECLTRWGEPDIQLQTHRWTRFACNRTGKGGRGRPSLPAAPWGSGCAGDSGRGATSAGFRSLNAWRRPLATRSRLLTVRVRKAFAFMSFCCFAREKGTPDDC